MPSQIVVLTLATIANQVASPSKPFSQFERTHSEPTSPPSNCPINPKSTHPSLTNSEPHLDPGSASSSKSIHSTFASPSLSPPRPANSHPMKNKPLRHKLVI